MESPVSDSFFNKFNSKSFFCFFIVGEPSSLEKAIIHLLLVHYSNFALNSFTNVLSRFELNEISIFWSPKLTNFKLFSSSYLIFNSLCSSQSSMSSLKLFIWLFSILFFLSGLVIIFSSWSTIFPLVTATASSSKQWQWSG